MTHERYSNEWFDHAFVLITTLMRRENRMITDALRESEGVDSEAFKGAHGAEHLMSTVGSLLMMPGRTVKVVNMTEIETIGGESEGQPRKVVSDGSE